MKHTTVGASTTRPSNHTNPIKKALSLFLSLVMLLSITAGLDLSAYATTSGDFEYEVLEDGTAEITKYTGSAADLTIPSKLSNYSVTSIGDYAVVDRNSLTSITIPDSVTRIGNFAFSFCPRLASITMPNSVKSVGKNAFYFCDNLKSLTFGSNVTSIGDDAFSGCNSLTSIDVDSQNQHYASQDGVLLNKDMTELIQYPIGNKRTSYKIPDGVTSIGYAAFAYCDSLTSVTIPDGVTSIGYVAFAYCDNLTSVTIPDSVTSIDCEAFAYCDSLTSIAIPDSVASISNSAFIWCDNLTSVTIGNSVTSICNRAFNGCGSLTSVTIGNSVTNIGNDAFSECDSLTRVTIPNSVTSIGNGAFEYCENLTDVYYNSTIADWNNISIGDYNENLTNSTIHCTDGLINKKTHTYKKYVTKATTKKNGSIVTKCTECGYVKSKSIIYYPKNIKLSSTSYTYNGKVRKPTVTVKDSKGNKINSKYYTVTYSKGRKNVGKYTVTVKFKGNYSGTVNKTFTIKPKTTSLSNVTPKSKGFIVKWKKQATQTTGYQIQYATNSKFTKNKKTATISKNKTTSKKISNLKAKKKYYVRIRTYKTVNGKKIYSSWSKYRTVTTKK